MTSPYDPDNIGDYLISARNLAEYSAFFALTSDDRKKRILDCPGGATSVVAELTTDGSDAIAVDPVYNQPADTLSARVMAEAERANAHATAGSDRYDWTFYGSPAAHADIRRKAAERFIAHKAAEPERYVAGGLPDLPFADASFDVALCSHLLFTYADRLDTDFHVSALLEMARVAREVRVYPLVDYTGAPAEDLLRQVLAQLPECGLAAEVQPVPYRFQKQATDMLVVSRIAAQ
ncbi:methyltransferase domain-containing protein [Salinibacterium sp. ZJ450]|uniref:methyltransferase domain-containing protein n=1 Tax=Salinibacterium sp. ZJ450 TaxID=2708338 RepID=UPI001421991D|nr:methyltransferase domain-containing protein [Salinibacterium sp. ZJ450]